MTRAQNNKKCKQHWIVPSFFCIAILPARVGFAVYVSSYYRAGEDAVQAMGVIDDISVAKADKDAIVFSPSEPKAGLIFYPGGKVEYTAYSPLMRACAEQGILCVLVKMPCNLAVLDMDAADGIAEQYPEIETGTSANTPWVARWRQLMRQNIAVDLMACSYWRLIPLRI